MIITRKGSFIPRVFLESAGHVMYVVLKWEENTPQKDKVSDFYARNNY